MKKLLGSTLVLLFLLSWVVPADAAFPRPPQIVTELDNDPLAVARRMVYPNGTLIDQGGGVFLVNVAGGGDLTALSLSTAANRVDIDLNTAQLVQVALDTAATQVTLTQVQLDTAAVQAEVDLNTVALIQVSIDTAALNGRITINEGAFLQVGIDTSALNVRITDNENQLLTVAFDTSSLQVQISANDTELLQVGIDTAALNVRITANEAILVQVGIDTNTLSFTLAQVQLDTATLQVDIDSHISATTAHGATPLNTVDLIVRRDGSGDFAAGTITATEFVGGGTGITGLSTGTVIGNGTINSIPLWNGTAQLTDSIMTQSGAAVSINGATPSLRLRPTSGFGNIQFHNVASAVTGFIGQSGSSFFIGSEAAGDDTVIQAKSVVGLTIDGDTRNIGLGVASPSAKLEIKSDSSPDGNVVCVSSQTGSCNMVVVLGDGKVGIGLTPTVDQFEVALNARVLGEFTAISGLAVGATTVGNNDLALFTIAPSALNKSVRIDNNDLDATALLIQTGAGGILINVNAGPPSATTNIFHMQDASNAPMFTVDLNRHVGLGILDPTAQLHVISVMAPDDFIVDVSSQNNDNIFTIRGDGFVNVAGQLQAGKVIYSSAQVNGFDEFGPPAAPTIGQVKTALSSSTWEWADPASPSSVFISTSASGDDPIDLTAGLAVILDTGAVVTATLTKIDCFASVTRADTGIGSVELGIYEDGSLISQIFRTKFQDDALSKERFLGASVLFTPTAGQHIYTCRARDIGAGGDSEAQARVMTVDQRQ